MSQLQEQVVESLNGLSDHDLLFLLEMIQRYIKPTDEEEIACIEQVSGTRKPIRKLGVLKGQKVMADDYDFDEYNEEIARLFGVNV